MADSSCTRDDRRERIVAECNAVRQALQDLLSEYMNNVSPGLSGPRRPRGIPVRDLVTPRKAGTVWKEDRWSPKRVGQVKPKSRFGSVLSWLRVGMHW